MAASLLGVALASPADPTSAWAAWRADPAWAERGRALARGLEAVGAGWRLAEPDADALRALRQGLLTLDLPALLEVLTPIGPQRGALQWVGAGGADGYTLRRGSDPLLGALPLQADWRLELVDRSQGVLEGEARLALPALAGQDLPRGFRWLSESADQGWENLFPRTAVFLKQHGQVAVAAEPGRLALSWALQPERWTAPSARAAARWLSALGELFKAELTLEPGPGDGAAGPLGGFAVDTGRRSLHARWRHPTAPCGGALVGGGEVQVEGLRLEVRGQLGTWAWRPSASGGDLRLSLNGQPTVTVRGSSAWTGWLADLLNSAFDLEEHTEAFLEGLRRGPSGAPSHLLWTVDEERWSVQGSFLIIENGLLRFALRLVGRAFLPDDAEAASLAELGRALCAALGADLSEGLGAGEPAGAEDATSDGKEGG